MPSAKKPSLLMVRELVRQIDQTGVRAIPIVFLISFLMGLVMAYQGALQLQKFGATIFVVDMVAISVLREMGVLLAAIMVAGRSGSAFAASLGVMNLNQETDALRVMGLNPNQVLVLPRISVAVTLIVFDPSARGTPLRSNVPFVPMPTITFAGWPLTVTSSPMNPVSMSLTRPATVIASFVSSALSAGSSMNWTGANSSWITWFGVGELA